LKIVNEKCNLLYDYNVCIEASANAKSDG